MVELEVLGWDNGFGQEKMFTTIGSRKYKEEPLKPEEALQGLTKEEKEQGIKKARFPSVHMLVSGVGTMTNSFGNDFSYEKMDILYNELEYFIGLYAIKQDTMGGQRNFNDHKYKDDSEVAKLGAGLALMFPEDGKIIIKNLVIGTSIRIYTKPVVKEAIEKFKNKTFKFNYPQRIVTGEMRKKELIVEIQNVNLIPQGFGGVQDILFDVNGRLLDENNIMTSRYGIIDIGTNTVDGFIRDGIDTHIENSEFWLPKGTSDVYKDVAVALSMPNLYSQIELNHIQGKETVFFKGQEKPFKDRLEKRFKDFAIEIYRQSGLDQWNRHLETIHKIVLTGGCASFIKDLLMDHFDPIPIIVPKDPQFANARGYYKYGIFFLRNQ